MIIRWSLHGTAILALLLSIAVAEDKGDYKPPAKLLKKCSQEIPPPCIDKMPSVEYQEDPRYSVEGRRRGTEGTVVLWAIVDVDGRAHNIRVQKTLGDGLDEQAIEALKQWKFAPAYSAGKPVAAPINIVISFRLR